MLARTIKEHKSLHQGNNDIRVPALRQMIWSTLQSTELLETRDETVDVLDLAASLPGGGFCKHRTSVTVPSLHRRAPKMEKEPYP